jgi:hypothetical protein
MGKLLFLFQSTHSVIKAEKLCLAASIACNAVAVPREISSECGVALEIREEQKEAASALLAKNKILFSISTPS